MSKKFSAAIARIKAAPRLIEQIGGDGATIYAPEGEEPKPSKTVISSKLSSLRDSNVVLDSNVARNSNTPVWLPPPMSQQQVFEFCDNMGIAERPADIGCNLWAICTVVTPVQAQHWLSELEPDNRDPIQSHIQELILDLVEGNWMLHHQGMGIGPDGNVKDGHHRLAAIYESRVAAPIMIVFNITDGARMAIDTQAKRRPQDVAHAISMATGRTFEVESRDFQVIRSAIRGLEQKPPQTTKMHLIRMSEKHREALDFVHAHFSSNRLGATSPVLGAIMRAWYHVDQAKLSDYCTILRHGHIKGSLEPKHQYATSMRNWLIGEPMSDNAGVEEEEETKPVHSKAHTRKFAKPWDFFGRATRSIRGFVAGETVTRHIYADSKEFYPLP